MTPRSIPAPPISARRPTAVVAVVGALALLLSSAAGTAWAGDEHLFDENLKRVDDHTYKSKVNLLTNRMARNEDGTINVVVEIPAGTNQKWEVSDDGMLLEWEFTGDVPRIIDYLPYPGNYGMVSRTWLDPEKGGDGQALDVMVLGTTVPRGTTIRAIPIGVVRVVDRFEQDDKILAIESGSIFKGVTDIESLDAEYPGVSEILRIWFGNVHGTSDVQMMGTGSRAQANAVIDYAAESFTKRRTSAKKDATGKKDATE
jgi:inorganic pyrophosphatase